MTQPTNTFDTYDSIGNREDLEDMIFNISPTATPFMSGCRRGKASSTYHEWQLDELGAVVDNKVIEGDEATMDAVVPTVRRGNYCQISDKTATVTGTQEAITKAGRSKEMAYQKAKKFKELKNDMEHALVGLNNARDAGTATVARELASVQSWIATNTSKGGGAGLDPTGDGTDARTDGDQRAFTEDQLKTVLQACWTEGGEIDTIMTSAFNKTVASGFTGGSTRFDKGEDKRLTATIDVYVSDFGDHKIVPNRKLRTRDVLLLDMSKWKIDFLRSFRTSPLAKTGDTEKSQQLVEYTLVSCQQKASGIIADLTTS